MYTNEKNAQILIALLKGNNISKVIASPGTTNMAFVRSLQNDSFFEVYSSVDERSAAYIACGLAAETGEPVVLSCTGATASRNYLPGLTEAYYRKLPILAVTSTQDVAKVGHHIAQFIDRSSMPKDVARYSAHLPLIKDDADCWNCEIKVNNAILELSRHGGGPVHINLTTATSEIFETRELPEVRVIKRITQTSEYPLLPNARIAVLVGSHAQMTEAQINALERFCEANDAVVFCDHTSGYKGKYCVIHSLYSSQRLTNLDELRPDLLIHIGEVTGDYLAANSIVGKLVWRVSEDGELRDTYGKLQHVFEMPEQVFFKQYTPNKISSGLYLKACRDNLEQLRNKMPELPFSNLWMAEKMHKFIPPNSTIHFAILNSLRSWNFFELPKSVEASSNVGGFGIDGCVSSLVGASMAKKDRLYFGIIGDLAFFYDLNSIGNRHVGNNLRILLVNNGKGTEFRNFGHPAAQFGETADEFIAAAGHFGNKSPTLVKNYSENLGFEYLSAANKEEFERVYKRFLTDHLLDKPILFEVFTNDEDESKALRSIRSISATIKGKAKDTIKDILGEDNFRNLKKIIKR